MNTEGHKKNKKNANISTKHIDNNERFELSLMQQEWF